MNAMKKSFAGFALLFSAAGAQADLVVVVNPGITVTSLSQEQVVRIFLGQSDTLPDGNRVVAYSLPAGTVRDSFTRDVLRKSPEQIDKYWTRMIFTGKATPPRVVDAEQIRKQVASVPGAIAFMERSQVDGSVKVITIN